MDPPSPPVAALWPSVTVVDADDEPCTRVPAWEQLLDAVAVPRAARRDEVTGTDLLIVDVRASTGAAPGRPVRPGTAIGVALPVQHAIDDLIARGCHTVIVDDRSRPAPLAPLLTAALPGRVDVLHGVLAELTRAGAGDALDPVALVRGGAEMLQAMFGVQGIAYLGPGLADGSRRVVAAAGGLASLDTGSSIVARHAPVQVRGSVVVAVDQIEVARDDAVGFQRFHGLMLAVNGVELDAMVVVLGPGGPRPGLIDVARALALVADRGSARLHTEQALRQQVAEFDALRELQDDVQAASSTADLTERLVRAAAATLGEVQAGVEAELDGHRWCTEPVAADAERVELPIVVAGRRRGRLLIGIRAGPSGRRTTALAACRSVIDVLVAHLAVSESRRLEAVADERQRRVLAELPAVIWTVARDGRTEILGTGALDADEGSFATFQTGLRFHLDALVARGFEGEQVRTRLHWQDRVWDVRVTAMAGAPGDAWPSHAQPSVASTAQSTASAGASGPLPSVSQVLILATDVTELQAARAIEAQLVALLDTAQLGIIVCDVDGTLRSWNRGAEALYGWRAAEMVGRHIGVLAPDHAARQEIDRVLAAAEQGTAVPSYMETRRGHRDGRVLDVGIYVAPITDPAGDLLGLAAIYFDLTERNEARRERAFADSQFQAIAEAAQDVIYRARIRPEFAVDFVSPACEQVLGFTAAEFTTDPGLAERRIHPADLRRFRARVTSSAEPASVRVRFQHGDGLWRWVEDRRAPLVVDGRTIAVTGVVRDVSAEERAAALLRTSLERERRAVEELRALDAMKNTFLSAVSHELRAPLTGIVGFAETAARLHAGTDPDLAALLERLVANAGRLEGLVTDLLDVDRLATGDVEPRRERLDLAALVTELLATRESTGHQVIVEVEPTWLAADRTMLERVVDNLVRNAQRHTPDGTTIWVRTGSAPGWATLTVEDDGPGVPADLHDRVFEPFQQVASQRTAVSPGVGIGLALVERFVALHGGEVLLDDRPGGGARFRLWLPAGEETSR